MPAIKLSPDVWKHFLEDFSRRHAGWWVEIETHDVETKETVTSNMTRLRSIELDLEDEPNPRINVTVKLDNKTVKHILFLPSRLVLRTASPDPAESLEIETVNTDTTVYVRPRDDS